MSLQGHEQAARILHHAFAEAAAATDNLAVRHVLQGIAAAYDRGASMMEEAIRAQASGRPVS